MSVVAPAVGQVLVVALPGALEPAVLLQLVDGETRGWGEGAASPGSWEGVVAELREGRPRSEAARCAWETALLDVQARRSGARVVDLLGGRRRDRVEVAAAITAWRPAEVAAGVEELAGAGCKVFQLLSVDEGGELDLERLGAARWAAGPAARLRLDFAGRLHGARHQAVVRTLGGFGLELVIRAGGLQGLPVAETPAESESVPEAVVHALRLSAAGGPVAALRMAGSAAFLENPGGTDIGRAAALHVACALPFEPLASVVAGSGGWAGLPVGPGLGVEPDLAALAAYRLDR